ncbi:MAG: nuclear transport factor 2 family protein [Deltaproteobacteria bacterium]|nr:nuclear transport factor 2 family protein [Deltaproteobacteria bacterium]
MSDLARFLDYARAFELAFLCDDFGLIEPFFADDARHRVAGEDPFAADDHGRDGVVAGLRASVGRIDRRFDARIVEIVEGPEPRDGGVGMRFTMRLRRAGLPDLVLEGDHLTVYDDGGSIARIDETLLGGCDKEARAYLERHDAALRPSGSAPPAPRPEDAPLFRDAFQKTLVRAYAAAKSAQDVEAALGICHPDFSIETLAFGTTSRGRDDTANQLALFFSVFPDYRAETEGLLSGDEGVAWWGRIALTFAGPLLGRAPTGRRATIPAFSIFDFRDGLLARERFFFDLGMLCDDIGVPLAEMSRALEGLRAAAE